ncbi:MAG: hypothetical protein VB913_16540 [Rhodospirillales bacterium]
MTMTGGALSSVGFKLGGSKKQMARGTHNEPELGEVLFQFVTQGNYVKVIAVDPVTNTEIAMVGDRRARKSTLQNAAIKSSYMLSAKMLRK